MLSNARHALAAAIGLCLGTAAKSADAAEPVRLQWARLEGAESCIDSAALETRVKRRLGSDPFNANAARSIEGVVRHSEGVWRARITVRRNPDDAEPLVRELESQADNCRSLGNAVVLAVALAVDPEAALSGSPAEPAPKPAEPVPAEPAPKTRQPASTEPESQRLTGSGSVALAAQAGLLPRASFGFGLGAAALFSERWGVAVRGLAFPEVEVTDDPSYAVGLLSAAVHLCARFGPEVGIGFRACAGPMLGLAHAALLTGDRAQPGERAWAAAEVELGARFAMTRSVAVLLGASGLAPLTRYRFGVEGSDEVLFEQSAIAGLAHISLQLSFGEP